MGYKWKYVKNKRNNDSVDELNELTEIIKKVLSTNVHDKRQYQELVDARIIFAVLARERGYTLKNIGIYLGMSHSIVVHYSKHFDTLIAQIPSFLEKYIEIKSCFMQDKTPIPIFGTNPYKRTTISSLKNKIEYLILQKRDLIVKYEKYERIEEIAELINSRTPKGLEDFVKNKINQMFNSPTFFK
jgi:predicted transcriptional regulator